MMGGGGAAAVERLSRGGDLAALAAAGLCAAVGAAHQRRKTLLEERLAEAESRARTAERSVDELTKIAVALRDRCDRSGTSMTFLADVAMRMSDPDPVVTSDAALELAMVRSGALCGSIQLRDDSGQLWTSSLRGPAIPGDLTTAAAIERATVVSADGVYGVRPEDSDLAAPLIDETGQVMGVIALHLVPYSELGPAARADLAAVARWAARALAPERSAEQATAFPGRELLYAHG
jgi:GAF domain-containing protein